MTRQKVTGNLKKISIPCDIFSRLGKAKLCFARLSCFRVCARTSSSALILSFLLLFVTQANKFEHSHFLIFMRPLT